MNEQTKPTKINIGKLSKSNAQENKKTRKYQENKKKI